MNLQFKESARKCDYLSLQGLLNRNMFAQWALFSSYMNSRRLLKQWRWRSEVVRRGTTTPAKKLSMDLQNIRTKLVSRLRKWFSTKMYLVSHGTCWRPHNKLLMVASENQETVLFSPKIRNIKDIQAKTADFTNRHITYTEWEVLRWVEDTWAW
jgi:hypothetical protein